MLALEDDAKSARDADWDDFLIEMYDFIPCKECGRATDPLELMMDDTCQYC